MSISARMPGMLVLPANQEKKRGLCQCITPARGCGVATHTAQRRLYAVLCVPGTRRSKHAAQPAQRQATAQTNGQLTLLLCCVNHAPHTLHDGAVKVGLDGAELLRLLRRTGRQQRRQEAGLRARPGSSSTGGRVSCCTSERCFPAGCASAVAGLSPGSAVWCVAAGTRTCTSGTTLSLGAAMYSQIMSTTS